MGGPGLTPSPRTDDLSALMPPAGRLRIQIKSVICVAMGCCAGASRCWAEFLWYGQEQPGGFLDGRQRDGMLCRPGAAGAGTM